MPQQPGSATRAPEILDVVVVGAGFSGLYALYKLRQMNLSTRVLEAGPDIGGTWFWNRYPGARCDVDSVEYSYSFSDELQQEWDWPDRFSGQPDILRYIHHVAQRFDLRRDIRTDTRVTAAEWNQADGLWTITTQDNERLQARFCIMATGNLSLPRVPSFPGLDIFKGCWYHTGLWPREGVDFTGRRVGVIGTGSSGVQLIPVVARQAAQLYVFQRTANFSLPARNRALDSEWLGKHKSQYPTWRAQAQKTPFGIAGHPPPQKNALEDSAEERQRVYEAKWQNGGSISFLYSYKDLLTNAAANETASEFVRQKIRATVRDPATAALLAPSTHHIGTKRLCLDTGYYETYNEPHVTLVDVKSAPIVDIVATGIRTENGVYELDDIIFATGFDAMTGALADIDISGRDGVLLRDQWRDGPRTQLGLMTAGFPNFFLVTGPGSPSVKANMIVAIEQHIDWIVACLRHLAQSGMQVIEAEEPAQNAWVQHVNEVADGTLYPLADSWYLGSNIPGKPRVFMPYVGGFERYKAICDEVARDGYRGFSLSRL